MQFPTLTNLAIKPRFSKINDNTNPQDLKTSKGKHTQELQSPTLEDESLNDSSDIPDKVPLESHYRTTTIFARNVIYRRGTSENVPSKTQADHDSSNLELGVPSSNNFNSTNFKTEKNDRQENNQTTKVERDLTFVNNREDLRNSLLKRRRERLVPSMKIDTSQRMSHVKASRQSRALTPLGKNVLKQDQILDNEFKDQTYFTKKANRLVSENKSMI